MPRLCRSDRRFPKTICRDDVGATSDLAVLAWARILLLFECFGTGLQRTCALAWARILLLFGCFGTGLQRTFCLAWARILLLFECFGTGLQGTCANGFGTRLAPRVPDKRTVFYGFQRWREAFCRAAFCLAWARILLLVECFGTGLQGTCANGFGTSLAPRVPDKRAVFYGFQRWREAFCRAAFCLAWARILLLFECFGTGLQGTCANGFGTSLAPRVPDKRTVFYGFQRWREAFCRAAFCLAWARILLLFECFGTGLQGTCANGFGTRLAPRVPDKRAVFYGFQRWREAFCRAAFCLAWARILLLFECFGTGLQGTCAKGLAPMVSEPASHRGCQTKELFFMDSKGDGKHFVGLRFAWHGLESCCCSSVSEPASKGLAPMVSEPASHRGCQTKELFFMGSKGDGKHFVGLRFAWHGLESCCCSGVSEPASKGLAPMVSEPASHRGRQTKELFFMGSKGDGKHFVGLRFAWHGLESCCCSSVSEPASKGLAPMVSEPASHQGCQTKELFFMGSKGDGKHFVGLRFAWHGLESCCCSSVSEPASNGLAPMVSEPASHRGCQTKELFFMGSKGDGKHFVGLRFAWHGLESCWCSSVSEPASKGLAPMVSEPGSHRGCQTKELFFMGSKGDGKHFVGLRFAWHGLESCCCSSVSEPASKGLAPMVSEPASHRGCQTKELFFMGSKGDGKHFVGLRFAWHGLESCCCSSVSEPASKGLAPMVSEPASHRGCQTKELFFMGSKGDGKHFVGLRFAWHGLESCCCSSVSEPASKGLAPMVSEPGSHRGCQTKELFFMGSKGDGKHFVGLRFAWHGLESCCCSSVSEPASKGLAPMVSEPASHRGCQTKELFFMGSKRWREAFCRAAFCLAWARILLLFECFGTGLQGTCANGFGTSSNPAAVRVFRNRPPRDLRQWFRNQPRTEGARQKNCFLWVPKVTGSILSGCVLLGMGSNPVAVRVFRNRPPRDLRQCFGTSLAPRVPDKRAVFYGFQRWREAFCRAAFCLAWARILLLFGFFGTSLQRTCSKATGVFPCKAICRDDVGATSDLTLAWARILLLFECFGTGLQGTCANGFGTRLAPRVPDNLVTTSLCQNSVICAPALP